MRAEAARKTISPRLLALAGGVSLAVFLVLAVQDWASPAPPAWDVTLTRVVQSVPGLTPLMYAVSWPGWAPESWIIVLTATALFYLRGVRTSLLLPIASVTTELLVNVLKPSIGRVRPDASLIQVFSQVASAGFPSGHTAGYTVFLGYISYLTWAYVQPRWQRRAIILTCATLLVLVGPSRVYLGHHWPSDVLAGYALGLTILTVLMGAEARYRGRLASRAEST